MALQLNGGKQMAGFDSHRFIDLNEREENHLKCGICLNIFNGAVNSHCGHTFCKQCIENWIYTNHTECPECRQPFGKRKKAFLSTDNDNRIVIKSFVFNRNLKVNAIISELKTKCDFEFNGCQEVLEFGVLSSHLNKCEHRFCKICNNHILKAEEHNCFELMREDRNEWKLKYENCEQKVENIIKEWKQRLEKSEQTVKELTQKLETELNQKTSLEMSFNEVFVCEVLKTATRKLLPLSQSIEYIVFGSFRSYAHSLQIFDEELKVTFVSVNHSEDRLKRDIRIPFVEIEELIYCSDPRHPLIIIKISSNYCLKIQKFLNLGPNSGNDFTFDVNSNDAKHWFILIKPKHTIEGFNIRLIGYYCRLIEPKIKTLSLDLNETRKWIENIRNNCSTVDDKFPDSPVP